MPAEVIISYLVYFISLSILFIQAYSVLHKNSKTNNRVNNTKNEEKN